MLPRETIHKQRGSMLLPLLVLVFLLLGLTGALVSLSLTQSGRVAEAADQRAAFYLADGGLQAAFRELYHQTDPDGDGVGVVTLKTEVGVFQTAVTQLGSGQLRVRSVGSVGRDSSTLQSTLQATPQSRWPPGAISIVGSPDKEKIKVKKHAGLILDGGDDAAISATDGDLLNGIAEEFIDAFGDDIIPTANISGGVTEWFDDDGDSVELPFHQEAEDPELLTDLEGFYSSLYDLAVSHTVSPDFLETQKLGGGSDVFTYGSVDDPQVVHFTEKVDMKGDDLIQGHGTLIIGHEFKLNDDSRLEWDGDVFIIADEKNKAKVEINGAFDVTGNVFVLGEDDDAVEFKVKADGAASISGGLVVGNSLDSEKAKKSKLEIDGAVTVDGVVTFIGSKLELVFKDDSDFLVNGKVQVGIIEMDANEEIKLEFNGNVEIHNDPTESEAAGLLLYDLMVAEGVDLAGAPFTFQMTTLAWTDEIYTDAGAETLEESE